MMTTNEQLLADGALLMGTELYCPDGCAEPLWDKGRELVKCWGCGMRFDYAHFYDDYDYGEDDETEHNDAI